MQVVVTAEKKYCPYCYWTAKTNKTHCPRVGEDIVRHQYQISVPLLNCKPDTSNYHKEARSLHQSPYKTTLKNRTIPEKLPKIKPDLETLRMMQKRARKVGIIRQSESPIPNFM